MLPFFFPVDLESFVGPGMWLLETIIVVFVGVLGLSRARRCIIRVRVKDGGGQGCRQADWDEGGGGLPLRGISRSQLGWW